MITAYVGLPGTGKSYGVVANVILPALKAGRNVWTNIPINHDAMIKEAGSTVTQFTMADIEANERWFLDVLPKGAVCVLDEAWRLWPAGIKAAAINPTHKEYLAEIRHLVDEQKNSSQLCIVTQDLAQVASFSRLLIETTYVAYKLSHVGMSKRYRIDIYNGAVTGFAPPKSRFLRSEFGTYEKKIYKLYKSHTKSDVGAGNEKKIDNRNNLLKGWRFKMMIPGVLLACYLVYAGISKIKSYYMPEEQTEIAEVTQPVQQSVVDKFHKQRSDDHFDFFKGRDNRITLNLGNYPFIRYRFESVDDDSYAEFTVRQVNKMGYEVIPINDCLVYFKLITTGKQIAVTCKNTKPKRDMFGFPEQEAESPYAM